MWDELYSVFEFWIERGVRVFRVDNPHTKAFPFWEWCLGKLESHYPEVIFLCRGVHPAPRPMRPGETGLHAVVHVLRVAQYEGGNPELPRRDHASAGERVFATEFLAEYSGHSAKTLQEGGRPAFMHRVILAATLSASYGIYGPAYELAENAPARPPQEKAETEEYLNSEKYEIRQRDRNRGDSLVPLISSLNRIRRENRALQSNSSLHFHSIDNPQLICYSKATPNFDNTILVVVNIDPFNEQAGWTDLDLDRIGCSNRGSFVVDDLLSGTQYVWRDRNYVALQPGVQPAHILRVSRVQ